MSLDSSTPFTAQQLDEVGRELLFTGARTANAFSNEPVTDDELAAIWDLAKWAPTGGNSSPLRILFVRTEEGKARLLEHIADGNKDKTASAPVVAVLAVDTQFHEHIPTLAPHAAEMQEPCASDEAAADATSRFNATLQAGYLILAIRAQGLTAGPMAGFDGAGVDNEFFCRRSIQIHSRGEHRPPWREPVVRPPATTAPCGRTTLGLSQPAFNFSSAPSAP